MRLKFFVSLFTLLLVLFPLAFSQSKDSGAIVGVITDEEATPLPGITVTLSSPNIMGVRTAITDGEGEYRFPSLPPGVYNLKAKLQGFTTVIQENIRLHTTIRLTVDITMKMTTLEEEIIVVAQSPTIDVKTSETASVTLLDELLRNLPTLQTTHDIVNLAPGVDQDVAYGASARTGIAYQVDGVDVSDPSLGSAWVLLDYNIIEEAKVMGIGLPAEYGAFTGVIFNTITKSGGNDFSGHAEFIFQDTQKGFWTAENNRKYSDDFPELESPVQGLLDLSAHIGGPIIRDRLWFFAGVEYLRKKNRPAGFQEPHFTDNKLPRFFLKLTWQASSSLRITSFFENDIYNSTNKGASVTSPTPETCLHQNSASPLGNFSLNWILNPQTFIDLKGAFFNGYFYLEPQVDSWETTPAYFRAEDYRWYDNSFWLYKSDRKRYQANAAISHFAEDFIAGNHDFKFGGELDYGWTHDRWGYTGYIEGIGNAAWIYDWFGYLYAYQYEGYDVISSYTRTEFYAQDAWSVTNRVTLNFGVRYSLLNGNVDQISRAVYSTSRWAPRVGFAWDLFGDHTTVLKAHYGEFTEAMYTRIFFSLAPDEQFSPYIGYYEWDGEWYEFFGGEREQGHIVENYGHPFMRQYVIGIERELVKDVSFGISCISRSWHNFLSEYNAVGQYELVTVTDKYDSGTWEVYNALNPGENEYWIANIKKGDPWILEDPSRKYRGIEILLKKRLSGRWQLLASYVYSQCKGTMDNDFGEGIGWASTSSPNSWINRDGHVTWDPKHMLKIQGTYILPGDIWFNAHFSYISGNTWTKKIITQLNQGRIAFFAEPKGSRRYDARMNLDLRLEKTFMLAEKYRFSLMMDIFNVFNSDTITSWGSRWGYDWLPHRYEPDAPGPDGHVVYDLVLPRAIRLGVRFFF